MGEKKTNYFNYLIVVQVVNGLLERTGNDRTTLTVEKSSWP